ncbi:MAG: potassium transporter Kup [Actinobacteria bacterium]|nr:potassium transporter Kup [Actinomycetota bacterium]
MGARGPRVESAWSGETDAVNVTKRSAAQWALAVGALGVVFGDIGTSPLYTVQTLFNPSDPHPVKVSHDSIFGVISLIFWSVMIIVTITYVMLVMRADNDGEGGIMALIALIRRRALPGGARAKAVLAALGIFGASLFFGDSMITPAISVLSAVEGVKVAAPSVSGLVIPITVAIIVVLFLVQRLGTGAVGRMFGPIMGAWFTVIALLGIRGVAAHPVILEALSPTYALGFLFGHFGTAFFSLTAVVLAVTGAEALYADMGHFGRGPIRRAWLLLVFPACILNYLGQGALILGNHATIANPFFLLAPGWARLPMVFLATVATVIASQAVISGAYSVAHQAGRLGYLPRLRIQYTSEQMMGQIYVPWINWLLLAAVLTLVLAFRSSAALAYAYGTAVTGTITTTTLLFFYYARHQWRWPLWIVLSGGGVLLAIDLLFFAANLTKLLHGAWLPLLIGIIAFAIFTTWQRGRQLVTEERIREEGPLPEFIEQLHAIRPPLHRVPGTAVFLNRGKAAAPLALRANVEHNEILHEHVLILSIETMPAPHVPAEERLQADDLGYKDDRITYVAARFGYMDQTNVPGLIALIRNAGIECPSDDDKLSYFVSRIELVQGHAPGMSRWRKRLFVATSRITADAAEYFRLPRERTVIMGSRIEI